MGWDIQELIEKNWATLLTGGIGLVLSAAFYFRGKKEKSPRYTLEDNNLFEKLPELVPDLKVEYKGEPVANLTIAKVRFFNAGKVSIKDTDVAEPIVIEAQGDCKILTAQVIRATRDANEFRCIPSDGRIVQISFRYLDRNEGALIQIKKPMEISGAELDPDAMYGLRSQGSDCAPDVCRPDTRLGGTA